jgi:hypothetical protein
MKTINQIYSIVLESILLNESAKEDAIDKFSKYTNNNETIDKEFVKKYVDKFWDEIRHKETDPKKKDINYWLKEGYVAFIDYIDDFKSAKDIKRDSQNLTSVDNGKGKLLAIIDDYELWQVDSYKAAKYLGRNYKNMPTKWCISSNAKTN